jgi:hypothetical protein
MTGFNDNGPASISRVTINRTGKTIYFLDRVLARIRGGGVKGNYYDAQTGEEYWVSGVKRNGEGRHWVGSGSVEIDDDARYEYYRLMGRS